MNIINVFIPHWSRSASFFIFLVRNLHKAPRRIGDKKQTESSELFGFKRPLIARVNICEASSSMAATKNTFLYWFFGTFKFQQHAILRESILGDSNVRSSWVTCFAFHGIFAGQRKPDSLNSQTNFSYFAIFRGFFSVSLAVMLAVCHPEREFYSMRGEFMDWVT